MQAIRIEHKENGYGIFRQDYKGNYSFERNEIIGRVIMRHGSYFLTPFFDGDIDLTEFDGDWFCAYKTIEQLNEWIYPDEIEFILNNNFAIYLLELRGDRTKVQNGKMQVVFSKEAIKEKKNISELFL